MLSSASSASRRPLRISKLSKVCLLNESGGSLSCTMSKPSGGTDKSVSCKALDEACASYCALIRRVTSSGRDVDTSIGPVVRMDEALDVRRVLVVTGLTSLLEGPASGGGLMVPYEAMMRRSQPQYVSW